MSLTFSFSGLSERGKKEFPAIVLVTYEVGTFNDIENLVKAKKALFYYIYKNQFQMITYHLTMPGR